MKTIEEIRQLKLVELLNKNCEGSITKLAQHIGKSCPQVCQWVKRTPYHNNVAGRLRSIGSDSARAIEIKFKKPVGWMDNLRG